VLSFEICPHKTASSIRSTSEFQSSSPRCTPMGRGDETYLLASSHLSRLKTEAALPKEILSRPLFSCAASSVLTLPLELSIAARRSCPNPTDLHNDGKLNEN